MKITKEEALALVKELHNVVNSRASSAVDEKSTHDVVLEELSDRLDSFLLDDCDDETEANDCYAGDDIEDTDPYEAESDDEDDEEEGDEEEEVDGTIDPHVLHGLKPVKTSEGYVEFEDVGSQTCVDMLFDGLTNESVTHVKRESDSLNVRNDDGVWLQFNVSKWPTGWAATLPLNQLLEVVTE